MRHVDIGSRVGDAVCMPSDGPDVPLRNTSFQFFVAGRSFSRFSSQVGAVAVGWQVYELTNSAFALGMVGLVQFLPTALLVFVAWLTSGPRQV